MPRIERRLACGCSTAFVLFVMGAVALVYGSIDLADYSTPRCGVDGKPPLRDWLFGTGISFIAIASSFVIVGNKPLDSTKIGCCDLVAAVSNLFLFAWAIVGAVSLGRDGKDCEDIDPALYRCSLAALVINWIVCCCGGFVVYESAVGGGKGGEDDGEGGGDEGNKNDENA